MRKKYTIKPYAIMMFLSFLILSTTGLNAQSVEPKATFSNNKASSIQYQLISAQKEISELYDKNFTYIKKIKELEKKCKKLKEQENSLQETIISKEKEIKKLSNELASSNNKSSTELLSLITQKEIEINKLTKQSNLMQQKLLVKEKKIEKLSSELASSNNKSSTELLSLITKKEMEINKLIKQSNSMQQKLLMKELELKNALTSANKKIKTLKDDNSMLSSQIQTINIANSSKIKKLNNTIYKANTKIYSLKNKKCSNPDEKIIAHLTQNNVKPDISYYSLARAYHDNKNYKKAIFNYNKTLQVNPGFQPAHLYLGIAYAETNNKQNTLKILNNYLKITKDKKEREIINNYLSSLKAKY